MIDPHARREVILMIEPAHLASVRVGARVGHREQAGPRVAQVEVFVVELLAVDAAAPRPVTLEEVAALSPLIVIVRHGGRRARRHPRRAAAAAEDEIRTTSETETASERDARNARANSSSSERVPHPIPSPANTPHTPPTQGGADGRRARGRGPRRGRAARRGASSNGAGASPAARLVCGTPLVRHDADGNRAHARRRGARASRRGAAASHLDHELLDAAVERRLEVPVITARPSPPQRQAHG